MLPILRDELDSYCSRLQVVPDALVFGSATGAKQGATNIRRRILAPAVDGANTTIATEGVEPLPEGLTPHSLRRTYASLLFAIGEAPPYVMAQLGHVDPKVTLGIYAKVMDRRDGEPERLKGLVRGRVWTALDSGMTHEAPSKNGTRPPEPVNSGVQRP
jgi:integrase